MTREEWRPVIGFEGHYEVSNRGRVRGMRRKGCHGKPLIGCSVGTGYLAVWLSRCGKARPFQISHLVAAAFIGPRPNGQDVAHNNGDKRDNRASNLRYATRSDNNRDKRNHGTTPRGSRTSSAQLNESQIPEVRALEGKLSSRETGARYGVGHAAILDIWRERTWTHV